jgi:Holliday junction resolvase RusA-like endonuclease
MKLIIHGHCLSKKNHRPIFRNPNGKPFLGKSKKLKIYERQAEAQLRAQRRLHGIQDPLQGDVACRLVVYYSGRRPDAFGPAETIYDLLEAAGVVEDDGQLVPWGEPAIELVHTVRLQERVEVFLSKEAPHDA